MVLSVNYGGQCARSVAREPNTSLKVTLAVQYNKWQSEPTSERSIKITGNLRSDQKNKSYGICKVFVTAFYLVH